MKRLYNKGKKEGTREETREGTQEDRTEHRNKGTQEGTKEGWMERLPGTHAGAPSAVCDSRGPARSRRSPCRRLSIVVSSR